MKTSPGPWRWGYVGEDGHVFEDWILYGADGLPVGVDANDYCRQKAHKTRFNENAALIADAPAMLELLREALSRCSCHWDSADRCGECVEAQNLLDKHKET